MLGIKSFGIRSDTIGKKTVKSRTTNMAARKAPTSPWAIGPGPRGA
jgi:hypothetical protein